MSRNVSCELSTIGLSLAIRGHGSGRCDGAGVVANGLITAPGRDLHRCPRSRKCHRLWQDTPKCRAPGASRTTGCRSARGRGWRRPGWSFPAPCLGSAPLLLRVLVCIHVPSGATVQHSIVQEKLLARNALEGITFRAILCYWGDPPTDGQEPRKCVGGRTRGACSPPAQPVEHFSDGGLGCVSLAQDASRCRWARAIMRARMRSPDSILSRWRAVYCPDVLFVVVLLAFLELRGSPENGAGLFLVFSFRISSRCRTGVGPPFQTWISGSGSCHSPQCGIGHRRFRQRRRKECEPSAPTERPLMRGRIRAACYRLFVFRLPFASAVGSLWDRRQASPPLPAALWRAATSLRTWSDERYPSKGISLVKS